MGAARARAALINYNSLRHGSYRFVVRAEIPGGPASRAIVRLRAAAAFLRNGVVPPAVRGCCCWPAAWAVYQMRLRQIRYRFALVLDERARLAREIHDTLAQGFVGISSQLDAVAMCMPDETSPGAQVSGHGAAHGAAQPDRGAALGDGPAGFGAGGAGPGGGAGIRRADVDGGLGRSRSTWRWRARRTALPQEMEQHLLRIAQEAVTNVLKHAGASRIWIKLHTEARKLHLRIVDNGRGFEERDVFSSHGGHFGLIGMRERAERLGGELRLASQPGDGNGSGSGGAVAMSDNDANSGGRRPPGGAGGRDAPSSTCSPI